MVFSAMTPLSGAILTHWHAKYKVSAVLLDKGVCLTLVRLTEFVPRHFSRGIQWDNAVNIQNDQLLLS